MDNASLHQKIASMDGDRLRAYRENLSFYNGAQWVGAPHRRERRLTFNYARAFVDKITSYLMTGMSIVIDPWDSSPGGAGARRQSRRRPSPGVRRQPPGAA